MDKNAIRKFAVWARRELIARVSQKAEQYGITENHTGDVRDESVNGHLLTQAEQAQRAALIYHIRQEGFQQVMEEVAYTWFNRFCALRFMEVNNYLPTRIRVFTDDENAFKPQILAEAIHMEMDGLDMDKVYQLKSDNKTEELYKYLLITQCNALYSILPGMFQQIADYTELLLPDNLLREGSVIEQMIALIPEEDWLVPEDQDKDSIQIIGWLYQYYNAEPKDQVFANLKKNIKISKHDIPAATQLFTPDWIVRYMVENSLGRLWVEGHPNDELKAGWKYYLEETEQEPDVQAQLAKIREEYAALKPEDIKCIDPCMGSGHILVYMFDVLVQIYQAYGYSTRETVQSIVENNLYGLDIDDRAAQLAYFAVMMKARQYDRRFFTRDIQPHVCAIQESTKMPEDAWGYFDTEKDIAQRVYRAFVDAKEYGSLIEPNVTLEELDQLDARLTEMDRMADYGNLAVQALMGTVLNVMQPLMKQARMLVQKYDVVVTNPPYMSSSGMSATLSGYVKKHHPNTKSDMFSVFMEKCLCLAKNATYVSMITQTSWMFLSTFERFRTSIVNTTDIVSLAHLGVGTFVDLNSKVVQSVAFVFRKGARNGYCGAFDRLFEREGFYEDNDEKAKWLITGKHRYFAKQIDFYRIPGTPIAYWLSPNIFSIFDAPKLKEIAKPLLGLFSYDNERFLRLWYEVNASDIDFKLTSLTEQKGKWLPHNKGGKYRRWYGNLDHIVWYRNRGEDIKKVGIVNNEEGYLGQNITWSAMSTVNNPFRRTPVGTTFDSNKGPFIRNNASNDLAYLLGFLNTKIAGMIFGILNPTISLQNGDLDRVPIIKSAAQKQMVEKLSNTCVTYSQIDWDSFETSWDFQFHPLVGNIVKTGWEGHPASGLVQQSYEAWEAICADRFAQLKFSEEELNRIFIDIYGLQHELTPDVADKDVTVREADLGRDIRSFISYAVGCMFGRYSIYKPGLMYAGGEWDYNVFEHAAWIAEGKPEPLEFHHRSHFMPDIDGILPICDDEYFADDIVGRFIEFVDIVFGSETLEENLAFIAKALGGSGNPKNVIRSYFLNDFYADHLKIYQKRPIYWLFDSGKKNGFKALIYMHRYAPDTIARIRTDYVHEQQSRYRTAIADLENRLVSASTGERVKLNKQLTKVKAQAEELRTYEEKIHHLADQMIAIDLDDGVKVNYAKFADVLAKIK